ncbi:CAP domain-containing protein [Bacillus sp. SCS-151]|uniref:CAP domain-containing protein n=1 Tax=Nanhaiella sioensis TaxID=3115293 RepID=UPI003978D2A6
MKRKIGFAIFTSYLIIGIITFMNDSPSNEISNQEEIIQVNQQLNSSVEVEKREITLNGLDSFIGKPSEVIEREFGKPIRVDKSIYDYDWWIYNQDPSQYIQIGVENNIVTTIYAIGEELNTEPFIIGQPIDEIINTFSLEQLISFTANNNNYRFELSEQDLEIRPLVKVNDVYIQLYFDRYSNKLSSIRYMDANTLIKQRPYELVYRGDLLSSEELSIEELALVEQGVAKQILDLTNIIRNQHNLPAVQWNEEAAIVAHKHSKEMYDENYFSHTSPLSGGLPERLKEGNVYYFSAGENIAAKYIDGIAVMVGWLNSKSHRETLLNENFTNLGVGVYKKYYTQNFIESWE